MLERRLINRGKPVPEFLQLWINRSRTKAIEKAYHQIGLSLRILGYSINPAETPGERGKALSILLPEEKETISDIVNEYEIRQYSNHHSSKLITRKASRQIRNLADVYKRQGHHPHTLLCVLSGGGRSGRGQTG